MIWFKRCALVAFLLAISVSSFVSGQYRAAPTLQNDSLAGMDEDTIDLTPSIELASEKTEGDRGADQIVGQSLLSPLLGQSLLTPGPINTLSLLFPALSSALLWGNLFPPSSFLGPQALLGSTQVLGSSQSDQLPSASKVVLVLAEDRDPHVAMRAANQEAARTIRQNDVFGQLLSQIRQADLGQMLSQSLEQMQQQIPAPLLQQNAEQFLQQIVSQDVSQSLGQMLSQTFQPMPYLDLSQLPLLGQAPVAGEPAVVAALDKAEDGSEAAAAADDVLTPNTPAFQIPNIQSAIDASTQMLGQVFQQPNADGNSGFQLPNIQSALDAGTQMLGQAFQQTNADGSSGVFQFPNIQSVIDSGSQMLSQSGGLFNLRPLQSLDPPMSDSDAEPAASQISEVRVKPDVNPTAQNERKMQTAADMDELKMLSAMQKAFIHKKLPILWFRMPSDSPERDDDFELKHHENSKNKNMDEQLESKLQAFERQVIAELKFLQDIERKAKEMRAASKAGAIDKTSKDATNHHASILSKIPVHKITRADIEKALNDDYVKKLLHMAAITNRKASEKTLNGAPSKRQTMTSKSSITPRQMSRDEIMRLLAYAYRMANANGIQMMEVSDSKKLKKPPQSDSEGSAKQLNDENWLRNSKARQWEGERMQMPRMQNFEQNPTRMSMDRQMPEKTTAMGRQSLDEQTPPINENPMQTTTMPMEQQRPTMQQMQRMQSPFTADQRQWIDPNMGMRSWMQENTQMPVQRQWINTQSQRFPSENIQQPPAITEQSLPAMPILMAMQQPPMMMEEPRMAMQLPQADTQGGDGMMVQQMHPEMQRQMQELDMLGLATPQMPDNEGKARFKGHMFDGFGESHKGKGKGKGVRPTIINYYYNVGGRRPSHGYTYAGTSYGGGPSYGQSYSQSYGPSYGQSYGQSYGGSSGGTYRMAVGDDEIQAMLKEHNHMEMMPNTDPIPVIAAYAPTATFQSTTPPATDNLNQKKPVTETFPHNDKHNSAATATPPIAHTSKMSRLDCKLRLNGILDGGKHLGGHCARHKRNANLGTLQTIDANSLNELRKTYRESLREITLKPDEDPAEALMRYNAASIRQALEQANHEPIEVSTGEAVMPTIQTKNNAPYYDASAPVVPQPNIYVPDQRAPHNHYKLMGPPASAQQQRSSANISFNQNQPIEKKGTAAAVNDPQQTSLNLKTANIDETQKVLSNLPEGELKSVLELISHQMQTCCDKCRERIITGIKVNIKEGSKEGSKEESQHSSEKTELHLTKAEDAGKSRRANLDKDDEQFAKWLHEMEAKGYDSKYLTKSHHWEYLNSGKLALALESNEQQADNKIAKKTNKQSLKRYTQVNSLVNDEELRNTNAVTSNSTKGKAFAKKTPVVSYPYKEHIHVVNDELRHLNDYSEEVTSSPYVMRGKFKNSRVRSHSGKVAVTTPVKFSAMSQQLPAGTNAGADNAKVVELLSLLYDLSPKTESANSKPTQLSVMVMPIVATSTEGPEKVNTTSRSRTKRMRSRRKPKSDNPTAAHADENGVGAR